MGTTLNRHAYQRLIDEDLAWLEKQPHSLEREHIKDIVRLSPQREYSNATARPDLTEQARQQVELIIRTSVGDEYLNPLLIERLVEFAAEAATQGQVVGIERATKMVNDYFNLKQNEWAERYGNIGIYSALQQLSASPNYVRDITDKARLEGQALGIERAVSTCLYWLRFYATLTKDDVDQLRGLSPDPNYLDRVRNEAGKGERARIKEAILILHRKHDRPDFDDAFEELLAAIEEDGEEGLESPHGKSRTSTS